MMSWSGSRGYRWRARTIVATTASPMVVLTTIVDWAAARFANR